ncbi:BAHD acyltransferase At5g47980-like isoform X2 [Pyrus x bretschneideri]|uniref:BAHD acyltransferase At5g47980-like isoform X2 n=1 Tax=Pyrus x bretschneideri TaxID=225117 RepID=UPI0020305D4C|nr:BAHD acyltransferase At5g47980-like isoform X2 [Pyrus x bretschneideri]
MGSKIMASDVKVEVIHKETISPSCPTPPHLKTTNSLSFFDQLVPPIYIPLLLFYPICNNGDDFEVNDINHRSLVAERSELLKTSLSEALTLFYPFARSFQFNDSICCNDQGVVFLEAQVNCPISKIFDKPDLGMLGQLLPNDHTSHLLQVQANFFECGGLAIGVNMSHKVADASTLSKFINRWAAIALGSPRTIDVVPLVAFGAASSLFPPLDFLSSPPAPTPTRDMKFDIKERCTTRRFVFDGSKIAALKSEAASASVPNPTRVEVVSALIWKCAKEASRSNLGSVRPSSWCQTVNMRKVLAQTLADKDLLGNVVGLVAAKTEESSSEAHDHDLRSLVTILRKGIEEFKEKYRNGVRGEEFCQLFMENVNLIMKKDDTDSYSSTSWCRFPLYESNFGWGKPSWVFISSVGSKNSIVLLDARDGDGIEASLTFNEEDMSMFESNEELLEYASLNPSVICNPPQKNLL